MPERTWTTTGRTETYHGRVRLVEHRVVLDDGTETRYEVDESIPFAVATLIVIADTVLLSRQYRYPIGRWIYDLPGGAGERGETPLVAARRELEEEVGLAAVTLQPLHTFFVNPGRSAWPVHLFACVAGAETSVGHADHSDPAEQVHAVRMPVRDVDRMIVSGEIVDPSLIVARAKAATIGMLPPLSTE